MSFPPLQTHLVIAGNSIVPSRCQDCDCGTMVCHVLNRMHALAWLARLICVPVWDRPSTGLLSVSSCCPLHVESHLSSWQGWSYLPPDVTSWVAWEASVSFYRDARCAAVHKSQYAFRLAVSVWYLYFVNYVCWMDIDVTFSSIVAISDWFVDCGFDCP